MVCLTYYMMEKRHQVEDETIIKLGMDGGGSFFKVTLSTINP
jgi:hypothetical protein